MNFSNSKLVLINVYFPTDPQTANFNDADLIQILQDINFILNDFSNEYKVIIGGDFNTDLSRNSAFVNQVKLFISDNDLHTIWEKFPIDFSYCQNVRRNGVLQSVTSTIDHFLVKEQFLENCVDGAVLHFAENLSNHEIIYLKINCPHEKQESGGQIPFPSNMPNWKSASPLQLENLKNDLSEGLNELSVPDTSLCCRNLSCTEEQHLKDIEDYTLEILNLLEESVNVNIPKIVQKTGEKSAPGWKEFVEPIRRDLFFWRSVWISAGKPLNCQLHYVYRNIRCQYKYAIRRIRKQEKEIRDENFLQAAMSGGINNILLTLKKQRSTKAFLANSIDNIQGSREISEHFKGIYSKIYNKYDDTEQLFSILDSIEQNIFKSDLTWFSKITPDLIIKIIKNLNKSKNDSCFNFKSDALINCAEILGHPLSKLFKSYLSHGYIPNVCLNCSLTPIVKDKKKSKGVSSNYRLIAVSSLLLKLIDLMLLELFKPNLVVSSLQFGFQEKSSTTLCSWTLKECTNYFTNKGSVVYLCLMDMTKAFDNVRLNLLFNKLRRRIPDIFVRLMMFSYMKQQCSVKWGSAKSSDFSIGNGVRQGAVISPVLFNIYMDDLFQILRKSGVGCEVDNFYYGLIGYADDFALLSPTREGLQKMIQSVASYCTEHGITISVDENIEKSKTKCLFFNYGGPVVNTKLYDTPLPWVDSHIHLGHTIHKNESSSFDVLRARAEFISNIHALYQELGSINPDVFILLVQIYFTSFYGAVLWDLDSISANKLYTTWNVMIRNAFQLPYGTHRYILRALSKRLPLQVTLSNRFSKFCDQIKSCEKIEVMHLFEKQKFDNRSSFGRNYNNIIVSKIDFARNYTVSLDNEWRIPLVIDLVKTKLSSNQSFNFNPDEIDMMLVHACCS